MTKSKPLPGPRPTLRYRIADRFFKVITPRRATWMAAVTGVLALAFLTYTSGVTLANQHALGKVQQDTDRERNDRRAQVNDAICSVIDIIPPGIARIDAKRYQFKCGAYDPNDPSLKLPPGGLRIPNSPRSPAPSPGARTTSPAPAPSSTSAAPSPTGQGTRPGARGALPSPSAGASRTPRPSSTGGATTTVTASAPASPSRARLLPIPGCTVALLNIDIC